MVRTAVCSMRNERPYMEDRYSICKNLLPDVHLFAVYDGHGGHTVADALACHLPDFLRSSKTMTSDVATALTGALAGVDARAWQTSVEQLRRTDGRRRRRRAIPLRHTSTFIDGISGGASSSSSSTPSDDGDDNDGDDGDSNKHDDDGGGKRAPRAEEAANYGDYRLHRCGSTACVVIVETHMLTIANVGDSRAIMRVAPSSPSQQHDLKGGSDKRNGDDNSSTNNNDIVQLTRDHKPGGAAERARIERAGGFVATIAGVDRVMGMLSLSRAMGDWYARPYVSQTPDVTRVPLRGDEDYLLIASDGLWDVMSPREAAVVIDRVRADRRQLALIAAAAAAAVAGGEGKEDDNNNSTDDDNDNDDDSSSESGAGGAGGGGIGTGTGAGSESGSGAVSGAPRRRGVPVKQKQRRVQQQVQQQQQHLRVSGPSVARALVDEAIRRGSSDNITVVWVDLSPPSMLVR